MVASLNTTILPGARERRAFLRATCFISLRRTALHLYHTVRCGRPFAVAFAASP